MIAKYVGMLCNHTGKLPRNGFCGIITEKSTCAPVAQLDRAPASGAGCRTFESCRVYH